MADRSAAGRSLLEIIWEALDRQMDEIMDGPKGGAFAHGEHRGHARGLAEAIAIIENPYRPNMDSVRTRAHERWEERINPLGGAK